MKMFAAIDIKSSCTGKIYAPQGTEIDVYNTDHSPVMCCRVGDNVFPAHLDKLCEDRPEPINSEPTTTQTLPSKKQKQTIQKDQLNLF